MLCKCNFPLMQVYSDSGGWQAVCLKCGHTQPLHTPAVGKQAAQQAFCGWSYYFSCEYARGAEAFRAAWTAHADAPYLWAAILCDYGAKYLPEPSYITGETEYILNFWRRDPPETLVQNTRDYADLLACASAVSAPYTDAFRREAELIDHQLRQLNQLQHDGETFDIFISYKDLDAHGNDTPEKILMRRVARQLEARTLHGRPVRVFFAPTSLGGRHTPVSDFGGWLHVALRSAKLMVLIASDPGYASEPWLKSEWQRFLRWNEDGVCRLMTCTIDPMTSGAFPGCLRKYQTHLRATRAEAAQTVTANWFAGEIYQRLSDICTPAQVQPVQPAHAVPDAHALYIKGMQLLYGIGTPRNAIAACDSFNIAAQAGDVCARFMRGHCIDSGYSALRSGAQECFAQALPALEVMAEQGDCEAHFLLGFAAFAGLGTAVDDRSALHHLTAAHLPQADHLLAQGYAAGRFGTASAGKAAQLFRSAAEQGFPPAMAEHARLLMTVPETVNEAILWLERAAQLNDPDALYTLGMHRLKQSPEQAVELFVRACAQGHAPAINALGSCCMEGTGVSQDTVKGAEHFRAASAHYPPAAYNYARCLYEGRGAGTDFREACRLFEQAARSGIPEAHFYLGECLLHAKGVTRDSVRAVSHYRLAAAADHAGALCRLGQCSLNGDGLPRDDVQAAEFFRKGAALKHAPSQYMLGDMALHGRGSSANPQLALFWYRKAARQHYPPALRRLGECCRDGRGMPAPDADMAAQYFAMADEAERRAR